MNIEVHKLPDARTEPLGTMARHVLFSPSQGDSQYIRMAIVVGQPGAHSTLHTHLGNEAVYTWEGEVTFDIDGEKRRVGPGQAIMIAPDTLHPATVTSDVPWVSVCFYCDECPTLALHRGNGGCCCGEELRIVHENDVAAAKLGDLSRKVLFTPSDGCVNFLRLAVVEGPPGAAGAVHTHLGNECFFTIGGEATQMIDGQGYVIPTGSGMAVPPDLPHQPVATGTEAWKAIAAFCDDCPVLKDARGKLS